MPDYKTGKGTGHDMLPWNADYRGKEYEVRWEESARGSWEKDEDRHVETFPTEAVANLRALQIVMGAEQIRHGSQVTVKEVTSFELVVSKYDKASAESMLTTYRQGPAMPAPMPEPTEGPRSVPVDSATTFAPDLDEEIPF